MGFPGAVFLSQHQFKELHPAPGWGSCQRTGRASLLQGSRWCGVAGAVGGREFSGHTGELVSLPHSPAAISVLTQFL